jgi:iron complex outermembrane receptor protein
VDGYVDLDVRLGWNPSPNWEFAVVGQNLLHAQKGEFNSATHPTVSTEVQRGVYGKVTWRY